MDVKEFPLEKTRNFGLPAAWEAGGGMTNTGSAQIIARPDGERPYAVYIRRRGHLACAEHALIVVRPGFYILEADRWVKREKPFQVKIWKIEDIITEEDGYFAVARIQRSMTVETVEMGVFYAPIHLQYAVKAAIEKTMCYHCRAPHYVRRDTVGMR